MMKRTACALYLACLAVPALAQTEAAPPAADAAEAVTAQIVVSGKRPGPGLWKVSKGEHVMWVFGLYSPLPQKMEWDSARVERLVAQSQEVLGPPVVSVGTGYLGMLTALPNMIGMKKMPDGAQLHDVVPAEVYTRWQSLKLKYIGDDAGIERYRPMFAADELMDAALKKNGLTKSFVVRKQIEAIAKKNGVKLTDTGVHIMIDNPGSTLKDFKKSQVDDMACFTKTLERFEGDMDAMRGRANAWANGKIAEISQLDYAEREDACNNAVMNGSLAKNHPAMQNMFERRFAAWIKAAETALDKNQATFAMLQMNEIMGSKSYLAALQAKGYTVESPK